MRGIALYTLPRKGGSLMEYCHVAGVLSMYVSQSTTAIFSLLSSHVDVSVPINTTNDVHTKSPTPEESQERPAQQVERATTDRRNWESVIFSQHTPELLSRPLEPHSKAASLAASSSDLFAAEDTVTYSYSKQPRPTRQPTHTAGGDAKYVPFVPVNIEELFG